MLDFRQMTLFCSKYRLPKHKMTICSENVETLAPLATPMGALDDFYTDHPLVD